jgi:hypothetical protein
MYSVYLYDNHKKNTHAMTRDTAKPTTGSTCAHLLPPLECPLRRGQELRATDRSCTCPSGHRSQAPQRGSFPRPWPAAKPASCEKCVPRTDTPQSMVDVTGVEDANASQSLRRCGWHSPPWGRRWAARRHVTGCAGGGRCVSIFLVKNRRHIGKSQSKAAAKQDATAAAAPPSPGPRDDRTRAPRARDPQRSTSSSPPAREGEAQ